MSSYLQIQYQLNHWWWKKKVFFHGHRHEKTSIHDEQNRLFRTQTEHTEHISNIKWQSCLSASWLITNNQHVDSPYTVAFIYFDMFWKCPSQHLLPTFLPTAWWTKAALQPERNIVTLKWMFVGWFHGQQQLLLLHWTRSQIARSKGTVQASAFAWLVCWALWSLLHTAVRGKQALNHMVM